MPEEEKPELTKTYFIQQLQAKNESERQQCFVKIQAILAEHNCDIDLSCTITGAGIQLLWGLKNK